MTPSVSPKMKSPGLTGTTVVRLPDMKMGLLTAVARSLGPCSRGLVKRTKHPQLGMASWFLLSRSPPSMITP